MCQVHYAFESVFNYFELFDGDFHFFDQYCSAFSKIYVDLNFGIDFEIDYDRNFQSFNFYPD